MLRFFVVLCFVLAAASSVTNATCPEFTFSTQRVYDATACSYIQVSLNHKNGQTWDIKMDQTNTKTVATLIPIKKGDARSGSGDKLQPSFCPSPQDVCPSKISSLAILGYELIKGLGYYKHHGIVKSWPEAKRICEEEGAHLAVINSEAEAHALRLQMLFRNGGYGWTWVGFHDQYQEKNYVTIFNQTIGAAGYSKWCPGNLDQYGGTKQNCGYFYGLSDGTECLADFHCESTTTFICERSL